ncbi:hypothetical protein [Alteromonas gilva]|uniref:Uncharacterized protein n=1 Tax=Alteromonas gilva TaxID=2987522 RepID=A0ABT5L4V8_9ALTE|nr:hypothetical protein [Alteromonas gilva]MDC8830798.1 hypothetical protein [Alteromonas gilva]
MPLQNRVMPTGEIVADNSRGQLMGNRGILHNDHQQVVKKHAHPNWVSCVLQHKGIKRKLMTGNKYTELFFLDEYTALSAGHRPCNSCRPEAFKAFKSAWFTANQALVGDSNKAGDMDKIIHKDRNYRGTKVTYQQQLNSLPSGTIFIDDKTCYLILDNAIYEWSFEGYRVSEKPISAVTVEVLTPKSIVGALASGYNAALFNGELKLA